MAIDLQLKTKVHSAFNSAIVSNVRNGITVGGRGGAARGATGVNGLEGDLPDTSAAPQLAMREQGDAPSGRSVDSGRDRAFGRRRSSGGEAGPRAGHPADVGDVPVSSSGNPFDRSRFEEELRQKPGLREKMAHISLGENQNPRANLSVIETMMNRAVVRGTSLEAQVRRHRSSGVDEGGYYAGYAPHVSGEQRAMFDRNLGAALGQGGRGQSNVSGYATDNSSGALARRESATGAFVPHGDPVNGESFFSPGRSEPAFRDRWRALNRRATEFERNREAHPTPSADQGSRGAPVAEPDVGPQSSIRKPMTVASRVPPAWSEDEAGNPLVENSAVEPFDYRAGDRPNKYLDENPVQHPEDNPTRSIPMPLPSGTPSGIVPPTPGDQGDKKPADDFSIPSDYDLG